MRQFGIIASALPRSKRWIAIAELCNGDKSLTRLCKLVYTHLQYTKHGNSAGAFEYPPEMASFELREPPEEIAVCYEILNAVGLIRYDKDEALIQIVGFFRFNSPTSRKHLAGPLRIIMEALPASPVRDAAACELVVDMYKRAAAWENSVDAKGAFMQEAANIIRKLHLEDMLCSADIGVDIDLLIALSTDLLIDLPIQGKGKDQGDNKTTDTDKTTETTRTQHNTGPKLSKSGVPPSAPHSTPAGGSRSGRGKIDKATAAIIADMTARSKGTKL